jgi:uncharacterized membrane protein YfcA
LMIVTGLGVVGSIAGAKLANHVPQGKLKKVFGYFLIVMGIYILARSVPEVMELTT